MVNKNNGKSLQQSKSGSVSQPPKNAHQSTIQATPSSTARTLLPMIIRILLVVLAVSALSSWYISAILETQTKAQLATNIKVRGDKASTLFAQTAQDHQRFKHSLLQLLSLNANEHFIFDGDGRLIAYSDNTTPLKATAADWILAQLPEPGTSSRVVFDERFDAYLAMTKITGPDWWLISVSPRQSLSVVTRSVAEFMLALSVMVLLIELLVWLVARTSKVKERAIDENINTLKAAHKQMISQEKMASLGTLTAGVAHEINNPTNFVHVGAQNLQADLLRFQTFIVDLAGDDADDVVIDSLIAHFKPLHDHIDTMINGTQRIKTIVKDLRAFTHSHSSGKKAADVVECLVSTISLVKTQYKEITEFVSELDHLPELECYPAQLSQVFMNIIVNACDAIGEKNDELVAADKEQVKGKILIRCRLEQGVIRVTFKDNGCGMSEQTRMKLYEPFYTTKPIGIGTGLGMSISFAIIEEHGGSIDAESVLGKGSLITVNLPL